MPNPSHYQLSRYNFSNLAFAPEGHNLSYNKPLTFGTEPELPIHNVDGTVNATHRWTLQHLKPP